MTSHTLPVWWTGLAVLSALSVGGVEVAVAQALPWPDQGSVGSVCGNLKGVEGLSFDSVWTASDCSGAICADSARGDPDSCDSGPGNRGAGDLDLADRGSDPRRETSPLSKALSRVISRIEIRVGNVFDPTIEKENNRLFRLANHFHRVTRDRVVERHLLFRPGDPLDPALLEESERLLRKERYLYEPRISYETLGEDEALVKVETHDVWTLSAGISYGHKGGEGRTTVEVSDSNFFGLGKDLTLRHTSDVDRATWLLRYLDRQWLGGRTRVALSFEDRSDGDLAGLEVERPFISLDDPRSWGFAVLDEERDDALYFRGRISDRFHQQQRRLEVFRGWSRGRGAAGHNIRRLRFGWTYLEDSFAPPVIPLLDSEDSLSTLDQPAPQLAGIPPDRTQSSLWVDWEMLEDAFEETRNLDKIGRTEDRNLGPWLRLRAGVSLAALGASRDQLLTNLELGRSWQPGELWLFQGSTYLESRYDLEGGSDTRGEAGGFENLRLGLSGRLYRQSTRGRWVFFVRGLADFVTDPDPETQLLLGGDSGLRGYPLRFQDGDRRLLLTVEERLFTDWTLFSLADVGAAAFVDIGRSWDPDAPTDQGSGLLYDVGVGLRLGMKRSGRGSVLHLDLAMPLAGDQDIAGLQWLVSTHQSF